MSTKTLSNDQIGNFSSPPKRYWATKKTDCNERGHGKLKEKK